MLRALEQEHAERRTPDMELMRLLIRRVDLIWRQMVAFRGGDPPDAIEVRLPGEKPPPKKSLRSVAAQAMQNMRRG